MFAINSVYDVISILSFLLAISLAIHKLFIEGKPKIKFDVFIKYPDSINEQANYLGFSIVNSGFGDLHLANCGFYTKDDKNRKVIVYPEDYMTIPKISRFPCTLNGRKKFEVLFPMETFHSIDKAVKITYFFVSEETGKDWKYPIAKFRDFVLENNKNSLLCK